MSNSAILGHQTVKVKLKTDEATMSRLRRDGIPGFITNLLWGRDVVVIDGTPYTVEVEFRHKQSQWNIAPECVEVVEL